MNIYDEVAEFYENYHGKKCVYGKSAEGRDLFAMFTGEEGKSVGISQYAIHAREWITALIALEHIRRKTHCGVWILPLTNPDGALLATEGLTALKAFGDAKCFRESMQRTIFRFGRRAPMRLIST